MTRQRRSGVFIVNFEHSSHFFLIFASLTLNKYLFAGLLLLKCQFATEKKNSTKEIENILIRSKKYPAEKIIGNVLYDFKSIWKFRRIPHFLEYLSIFIRMRENTDQKTPNTDTFPEVHIYDPANDLLSNFLLYC